MTHPLAPTTVLPTLATLHACDAVRVREALRTLRNVYFPNTALPKTMGAIPVLEQLSEAVRAVQPKPKRTAYLVRQDSVPDSGYASAEDDQDDQDDQDDRAREVAEEGVEDDDDDELDILRADELEGGYAVKWLTGLVKRGDAWVCGTGSILSSEEQEARTMCLEDAARLLARFAGDDAPEEALTRTFVFPFRMPPCQSCGRREPPPITVELNDAPVDGSDHTAVGLQSWGSAIVFAERVCSDPERYLGVLYSCASVPATASTAIPSACRRRVLELGAGTGLLSITIAQIFSRENVRARIKATDYHPSVLENLARNVRHNPSAAGVSVEKLDWCAVEGMDVGMYDVVLAADVVYHPEHARWIRGCVARTLKKGGVFWLIIPVRTIGRHAGMGATVEEVFPVVGNGEAEGDHRLAIVRREDVERVEGVGRADEGGYTLFEIRWKG